MGSNFSMKRESKGCKMRSATGHCPRPLETASAFLSRKWTISIVITVGNYTTLRFNALQDCLGGITAKTLTERLKELVNEGIVKRRVFAEIPPRVEYSLTKKGKALQKALIPLIMWADTQE
jgi:DNA-binding HxlR family transcriptional regulator